MKLFTALFFSVILIFLFSCSNSNPVTNNQNVATVELFRPFDSGVYQHGAFCFQWFPVNDTSYTFYYDHYNINKSFKTLDTFYIITLDTGTYHWHVSALLKNNTTIYSKIYTLYLY